MQNQKRGAKKKPSFGPCSVRRGCGSKPRSTEEQQNRLFQPLHVIGVSHLPCAVERSAGEPRNLPRSIDSGEAFC